MILDSAALDGYFDYNDYGDTWKTPNEGLCHKYLISLAVDSFDPQNVIVPVTRNAWTSYSFEYLEFYLY